jgi:hypothetical protein
MINVVWETDRRLTHIDGYCVTYFEFEKVKGKLLHVRMTLTSMSG